MTTDAKNNEPCSRGAEQFGLSLADAPDQELVELYVATGSRGALTQIIDRYGAMVATVCQATVSDTQAAEDAFQATFLVLIKSAGRIKKRDSLGSWLYGVAYRTAIRVRRQVRQSQVHLAEDLHDRAETVNKADNPVYEVARKIELETLSNELQRMPENLRSVLVEHYLLGRSAPSIAEAMDLSTAAVEGRLKRGRRSLRKRLAQRGVSMSIVVAACGYLQKSVAAGESNWVAGRSIEQIISSTPDLVQSGDLSLDAATTNSTVSSLVSKEVSMLSAVTGKVAVLSLVALAAGVTVFTLSSTGVAQQGDGLSQDASAQAIGETANLGLNSMPGGARDEQTLAQLGPVVPQATTGGGGNAPASMTVAGGQGVAANRPAAIGMTKPQGPKEVEWRTPSDAELPPWLSAQDPLEAAIAANREKLVQKISADFPGMPLNDVITALADDLDAPFWINQAELDAIGLTVDTPIDVQIAGPIRVKTFLRLALGPLELGVRVGEVIEVTTIDALNAEPEIRCYDLSYILPNSSNADALLSSLQQSIDADNWLAAGGESSMNLVGSMMVVAAPYSTHSKIESFLIKIRAMNPENARQNAMPSSPYRMMGGGMGGFGGGMGGMVGGSGYGGEGGMGGGMF